MGTVDPRGMDDATLVALDDSGHKLKARAHLRGDQAAFDVLLHEFRPLCEERERRGLA